MKSIALILVLSILSVHVHGEQVPKIQTWKKFNNLKMQVFEAQGTVLTGAGGEQYITIMGGFKHFPGVTKEVYTRKVTAKWSNWKRVQDLPLPITHMAQARKGGLFCGAGGFIGAHPGKSITNVYCFNQQAGKWFKLPNLPAPRAGGGLVFHKKPNGQQTLIFSGGVNRPHNSLAKHVDHGTTWMLELWKPGAKWKNMHAYMPNPRNHMGAVESCGRYFWVGGQHKENEGSGNQKTVSEYIPSKNKWKNIAPLPVPLGHISASVLPYKCGIMVVGGTSQGVQMQNNIWYWKAATNKWYKIGQYKHKVATPVCGIAWNKLVCGTGGYGSGRNKVYMAHIGTKEV